MICITKKVITMAEIEDTNTRNRFALTVDDTGENPKVIMAMQRYSRKQKVLLPTEEILILDDPADLDRLARLALEILAGAGYVKIQEEEEPEQIE